MCNPGCTKRRELPKEDFRRAVEKELTGKDEEPSELICTSRWLVYKSQLRVIGQAIETAALMLGSDKSRGYCLEMICADLFSGGANLDNGSPETLLLSMTRFFKFLPEQQKQTFLESLIERAS